MKKLFMLAALLIMTTAAYSQNTKLTTDFKMEVKVTTIFYDADNDEDFDDNEFHFLSKPATAKFDFKYNNGDSYVIPTLIYNGKGWIGIKEGVRMYMTPNKNDGIDWLCIKFINGEFKTMFKIVEGKGDDGDFLIYDETIFQEELK